MSEKKVGCKLKKRVPDAVRIPVVGVRKRGAYQWVHGGLPGQGPLLELA